MSSLTVPIPPDLSPACRARNTDLGTVPENTYNEAVMGAVAAGDFDSLIDFLATAIRHTCHAQNLVLVELSKIRESMIDRVTTRGSKVRFIDTLIGNPIISLADVIDLCEASWGSATSLIETAQELGFAQILDTNTGEQLAENPKYGTVLYVPEIAQLLGITPPKSLDID